MRYSHPTASPDARGQACDTARCLACGGILAARVATIREAAYSGVTILQCRACGTVETPTMRAASRTAHEAARLARTILAAQSAAANRSAGSNAARGHGNAVRSAFYGQTLTSVCRNARCGRTITYTVIGRRRLQSYCDKRCRSAAGNDRATSLRRGRPPLAREAS